MTVVGDSSCDLFASTPHMTPKLRGWGGVAHGGSSQQRSIFLVQISCREVDWERGTLTYWFVSVLFLTTTRGIAQDLAVGFW
jgi:hypothetical protein